MKKTAKKKTANAESKEKSPSLKELQTQTATQGAYIDSLERMLGQQAVTIARLETNISLLQNAKPKE